MTNTEKVKLLRDETLCPMNKINTALKETNWDLDKARALLLKEMSSVDIAEMEKRTANATIVYGYVHGNRIGALLSIACQTDFTAKNEVFLNLAKDICMHIVSAPQVNYISERNLNPQDVAEAKAQLAQGLENKPEAVRAKIVEGKWKKRLSEMCLLNQPFVKDDKITIEQLIATVSAQTREKIEIKKFVRMVAS
jgi:elongation factor Ts